MALEFLSSYFLNPVGLLGLLGLIPLIVFYLIRPEPEERVMPSMAFFMQQKESGKLEQALQRLMRNLLLILHILIIAGIAAALAEPYAQVDSKPENTVLILDRSASMADDMEAAKQFLKSNTGQKNTLIVAGEDIEVPLERASASRVRSQISRIEARDVETDIAGAIELAADYRGKVAVASDLDQTVSARSPAELLETLDTERQVEVMDAERSNKWGIVGLDIGRQNSSVDIKNFLNSQRRVEVTVNGNSRTVEIEGGAVNTLTFESQPKNRIELEEDSLESDNSAFAVIPERQDLEVGFISDDGNPYFEKAAELIEFTELERMTPPVEKNLDSDVYVIGRTDSLLDTTIRDIENQVESGTPMVIFSQPGLFQMGFDSLPVENTGGKVNASVEFEEPRRINVGTTQVYRVNRTGGESLSNPENALIRSSYGRGEVLLYNIDDSDFRFDFLYPIFWKESFRMLTDQPTVEELNIDTGAEINESSVTLPAGRAAEGPVKVYRAGIYDTTGPSYAANMISEDESVTEPVEVNLQKEKSGKTHKNLQNLAAILLALLAVLEMGYLRYTGDL